jgi:thiamine biosynthesis lipoprotein
MTRLFAFLVLLFPAATARPADAKRFEYEQPHMGTKFRIVLYAADQESADTAAKAVATRVEELNRIMSDYLPDSELMRLCKQTATKPVGPVKVSDDLFYVLAEGQKVAELSDGAFDMTVGPIVRLWWQARKDRLMPDADERAAALKRVGYKKMKLDPTAKTVDLTVPGMLLDLGGIAKGYAADEGLKVLTKHGIAIALVAASGDIAVSAPPPGKPGWRIDIAPLPGDKERRQLILKDAAVSTSGDSEQFVEIGGVRYSHIVNPHTGLGLTGRRSVTVVARHGIQADSLTKVASILPADEAVKKIESIEGAATLIVVKTAKGEDVKASKGFGKLLAKD